MPKLFQYSFLQDYVGSDIAAEHSEIWQFASQLEGHLTEVEDWDLGAGIYIEFLTLKSSFLDKSNPVDGMVCVLHILSVVLFYRMYFPY